MPQSVCSVSFPACPWCGDTFAARAGGCRRARVACSADCRREWFLEKRRVESKRSPLPVSCPGCGQPVAAGKAKPRKWCSNRCKVRVSEARRRELGLGRDRCAVSFPPCRACGGVFAARKGGGAGRGRTTCSAECRRLLLCAIERERHANLSPDGRQAKLERKMWRRAIEAGVESERFTPLEIFERDDWACGLCDEPVDQALKYPDPMCASVDHVIPVKLGGPHTRANVQCAHLVCNLRKGARLAAAVA